jgi:hypothetical protein
MRADESRAAGNKDGFASFFDHEHVLASFFLIMTFF